MDQKRIIAEAVNKRLEGKISEYRHFWIYSMNAAQQKLFFDCTSFILQCQARQKLLTN